MLNKDKGSVWILLFYLRIFKTNSPLRGGFLCVARMVLVIGISAQLRVTI